MSAGLDHDQDRQRGFEKNAYGSINLTLLARPLPVDDDHPLAEAEFTGRAASLGLRYSRGRHQDLTADAERTDYEGKAVDLTLMHPDTNFYVKLEWRRAKIDPYLWVVHSCGCRLVLAEDDSTRALRVGYFLDRNLLLRVSHSEYRRRNIIVDDFENNTAQRHTQIALRHLGALGPGRWLAMEGSILRQNPQAEGGAGSAIKLAGTYYLSQSQGLSLAIARTTENTENGRGADVAAGYEIFVTPRVSLHASYRTFRPAGEGDNRNIDWRGFGVNGRF